MAFKALFMAHAPDAEKEKHRSIIDTGKYKLFSVVVKNQDDAISVAKEMYDKQKIDSIILCPGFTHKDVSDIFQVLQGKVGITVARGDGPSNKISQSIIQKEFGG
jgi:hypothetical protein